ncbi:MAG: prenyltransferase [Deltaproteobacteria bacterium]|nr:prenyltransferase [Deltaproteobacteria bacterium]
MENSILIHKMIGWLKLSRPAFHLVGIFPFVLGTILAWRVEGAFHPAVCILGILAVISVMLATYYAGEYSDCREDVISQGIFKSRFAGGTGMIQEGIISGEEARYASIIALISAAGIGITLQFGLDTGPYTIPLGILGIASGFFYSTRPVRLVTRGIGEIFIGFCYGWLPIATAFYLQTGYLHPLVHWMGVPVGLTIFNVILLNEFHDYPADRATGKRNILVRLGIEKGIALYALVSVLAWGALLCATYADVPTKVLYPYIPVMVLSAFIIGSLFMRKDKNSPALERLCGLNIAVNLGTTASLAFALA